MKADAGFGCSASLILATCFSKETPEKDTCSLFLTQQTLILIFTSIKVSESC